MSLFAELTAPIRMRVLIVAGKNSAERLEAHLRGDAAFEVESCADKATASVRIRSWQPHILLVEIPRLARSAFHLVESIRNVPGPAIIFVASSERYALRAFEVGALDYLLKPIASNRLYQSLEKAKSFLQTRNDHLVMLEVAKIFETVYLDRQASRIPLRHRDSIIFIKLGEVDWIDAQGDYARFHRSGRQFVTRQRLNVLEKQLAAYRFARIHRSTIVNTERIVELKHLHNGDYLVVLANGGRLNMSRTYRDRVSEFLGLSL